jgi:hypothetical protein
MGLVFRLIIMLQYIVKARCVSILENKTNVSVNRSSSSSFSFLVMCAKVSPNHFDVFWSVIRVVF